MKESIKIDSVFLNFREHKVLRGISFEFYKNKVTGILGRNGCGKSCFLKIITGQLKPATKHLSYQGKLLDNLYKESGLINYLPQHEFHPKSIQVSKLIQLYGLELQGFITQYPFLEKNINLKFSDLSGGEKRILEVLLVMEADTKFTILDEPFSHIMPVHVQLVKDRIQALSVKKGILITDHQYQNVVEISDSLFLLKDGVFKIVKEEEDLRFNGYIR